MTRTKILFVTGTDTGVGKTTVSCALARAWWRAGRRVAVLKPIETGCALVDGGLRPDDALRVAAAANWRAPVERLCPNRYATPVSPHAAATLERRDADLPAIDAAVAEAMTGCDVLIVEGAGGLLVPISERFFMADLALRLGAPLLIVARASLGTVNHTLLTIEAARRRQLPIAGVVLNRPFRSEGPDEATNPAAIRDLGRVPVFGALPHLPAASLDDLADFAERNLDLEGLWQAI